MVKNQECKPRTAIPEPPSPRGSHRCRSYVPHLLVKMKLKKSKLLATAMKFRTPRMLLQDWEKWCCPLARFFPAPRVGSPCEWSTEKLLPLCGEWSWTTLKSKDDSGQESLWSRWSCGQLSHGFCFMSELDRYGLGCLLKFCMWLAKPLTISEAMCHLSEEWHCDFQYNLL